MATASISGLASGLDTATIIDQLMQLEAAPQTKLKTRLTTEQSALKSLQDLNSRFAALQTQAAELAKPSGWATVKASSSSTAVTTSAGAGAVPGSFSLTVNQTAAAHRLTFSGTAAADTVVVAGGTTVNLTIGGETTVLDTGDGTLDGLVDALNAAGTGVSATKVKLDSGEYRLMVTASQTGAAGAFTLTGADGSDLLGGAAVQAGRDAEITIGEDTIHSSTNTFADIVPGVGVTISAAAIGTTADIDIVRDTAAVADKVKTLVDTINTVLSQIDGLTGYNATTKTSGPLAGAPGVRDLRSALLNAVYPTDGTSMAAVGVQTDRYGKLTFDADAFAATFAEDPAGSMAKFTGGTSDGFATRVSGVATMASDKYEGTLTAAVTGQTSTITRIQQSIDSWDARLELRRTTLERQYTALETALSQMQSQSSWLTSQLNALSSSSSS